jgi:2-polyprenyl-3-methyl-5-hydroxy-6-metoxy-1,4-benzoquinol methylase
MEGLVGLGQVTSDCRVWSTDAVLAICQSCGTLQKRIDEQWSASAEEIYAEYTLYQQAWGAEQRVFEGNADTSKPRSDKIISTLIERSSVPRTGRLLDIGTGNGAFLRAFSAARRDWTLVGTELDDRSIAEIESIAGVERLYTCPIAEIPGTFTMISMVHVLEHLVDPRALLEQVVAILEPASLAVVEVPNYVENPFDLVIADHATHFSPETLINALEGSGLAVRTVITDAVPRETLAIGTLGSAGTLTGSRAGVRVDSQRAAVARSVDWLRAAAARASELGRLGPLGIFGSSIGGTWLHAATGGRTEFFVDEDPRRIGGSHLGVPIITPDQVPEGATVLVGLAPQTGARVANRLARPKVTYVALPPWN